MGPLHPPTATQGNSCAAGLGVTASPQHAALALLTAACTSSLPSSQVVSLYIYNVNDSPAREGGFKVIGLNKQPN